MIKRLSKLFTCFFMAMIVVTSMMAFSAFAADAKLSKTSVSVVQGKTVSLTVSGAKDSITWSVSDKNVAIVSKGVIKGVGVGTTTVTATVDGKKLTCKVTVYTNKIIPKSTKVSVQAGITGTVDVAINGISDAVCGSTDKSVCTAKLDAKKGKLTVTGVKEGTAKIKIFSKSDDMLNRVITVTVTKGNGLKSTNLNGTLSNGVYSNAAFGFKFKYNGFEYIEESKNDYNKDKSHNDVVLFMGRTANNDVMMVLYEDMKNYSEYFGDDFTAQEYLNLMIMDFEDGSDEGTFTTSTITIAGEKFYCGTCNYDDAWLTMACRRYGDYMLVIVYMSDTNNFSTMARCFTEIK